MLESLESLSDPNYADLAVDGFQTGIGFSYGALGEYADQRSSAEVPNGPVYNTMVGALVEAAGMSEWNSVEEALVETAGTAASVELGKHFTRKLMNED
jgi:hypothetical protein